MRSKIFVLVMLLMIAINVQTIAASVQRPLPVVITAPRPHYPPLALAKRISGTVLVDVEVDEDGKVSKAEVIDGPELLREISRIAARGWVFKASDSGNDVFTVRLTFIFHDESFVPPKKKPDFTSPFQVEILRPVEQF